MLLYFCLSTFASIWFRSLFRKLLHISIEDFWHDSICLTWALGFTDSFQMKWAAQAIFKRFWNLAYIVNSIDKILLKKSGVGCCGVLHLSLNQFWITRHSWVNFTVLIVLKHLCENWAWERNSNMSTWFTTTNIVAVATKCRNFVDWMMMMMMMTRQLDFVHRWNQISHIIYTLDVQHLTFNQFASSMII